jgi:hypothetical protein
MTNNQPEEFLRNKMKNTIALHYKEIATDKMVFFQVVELNKIYTLAKLKNILNLKKIIKKPWLNTIWLFRNNKESKT